MNIHKKETFAIGLEIGGTKIQAGIGSKNGKIIKIVQKKVIRGDGALGIRKTIVSMTEEILDATNHQLSDIDKIGIGFGGPVQSNKGIVIKSYQIDGWDNFPLKEWSEKQWGKPVIVQNDASLAGLAESIHGSGRDFSRVFYITLGVVGLIDTSVGWKLGSITADEVSVMPVKFSTGTTADVGAKGDGLASAV